MTRNPDTVAQWLVSARQILSTAGVAEPASDAKILLGGVLGLSTAQLLSDGDRQLTSKEFGMLSAAIDRRLRHEPVYRILGARSFYDLELAMSAETLEPRPDTEILVERMLAMMSATFPSGRSLRILDLGTGTGAIALALLKHCPDAEAVGTDISDDALSTALRNADINGLGKRFQAVKSHWFDAIKGHFDVIVSNPPYIRSEAIEGLYPEVRLFDPLAALDGGRDGLNAYRSIAAQAADFLLKDGLVGVEIGFDQKEDVIGIFCDAGFVQADFARDYGGRDRVLIFR